MKTKNNQINLETIASLEFYTKLSQEQRKRLINWFKNQNVEFQILIFEEQRNQFFKLNLLQKKEISKFAKKSRRKFKKNRY